MANMFGAGFQQGFAQQMDALTRLRLARDEQVAREDRAKEQLKLQQQQLKGAEATRVLAEQRMMQEAQMAQQQLQMQWQKMQQQQGQFAQEQEQLGQQQAGQQALGEAITITDPAEEAQNRRRALIGQAMSSGAKVPDIMLKSVLEPQGAAGLTQEQQQLVPAILKQPGLYEKIDANTRTAITPALVAGGFKTADLTTPEDAAMQVLRRQHLVSQIQVAKQEIAGGMKPAEKRKLQLDTRAAIRQEPAFKDFQAARSGYNAVIVGANQQNAQGDLSVLNGIVRLLDPGSVVRPSEFEAVRRAQGLIDQVETLIKRVQTGELMATETRSKFVKLSKDLIAEWSNAAKAEVEPIYGAVLRETGIPLKDVFVEPSTTLPATSGQVTIPPAKVIEQRKMTPEENQMIDDLLKKHGIK